MSDIDVLSSESSSEPSEVLSSSEEEDGGDYFELNGNFAPYQGEPLADSEDADMADDDEHEDGILPSVLEQRSQGLIALNDWCTCGNSNATHLVGAREYRCCLEISEARRQFTFIGLDAQCIVSHSDFSAMTNSTVLEQVGPFLRNKDGRYYRKRNNATQNKFLRAVAYRWLARWLFGPLGWENTRPLPSCVYHKIRSSFHTLEATGYVSGQERAD
ncbi:uncharacterized protein [Montipora capricornis]|uniref:uncharacterized protein n=1 Tax=Montipora capricornis TaxID=246305 RepID=UPI0035F1DA20